MSFTLSHPAAALPLRHFLGRAGVLSALFIGSMVPDFALFLPLSIARDQSHHWAGILWFCLPMGMLTYFIFHAFCCPVGIYLLPAPMRARLQPTSAKWIPDAPWWGVAISIVVGAITHVVWDGFTHANEGMVARWEPLRAEAFQFMGRTFYVHTVLQHGGTLLGLMIVGVWVCQWYWVTAPQPESGSWQMKERWRWPMRMFLLLPPTIGGVMNGWLHLDGAKGLSALHSFLFYAAVSSMGLLVATWVILGIIWRISEPRTP